MSSVAGGVLTQRGKPLQLYLLSAVLAVLALLVQSGWVKESLPTSARVRSPLSLQDVNPFGWMTALASSPRLTRLSLLTALQAIPAWMGDLWTVHGQAARGWGPKECGTFQGAMGMSVVVSGITCGRLVQQMGTASFSKLTNLLSILSFALFSFADTTSKAYLGVLLNTLPQQRNSAIGGKY